jgi:hypothetical protein
MTQRYAHVADQSLRRATETVAAQLAQAETCAKAAAA